jgi:lathosterol oxidase
MLSHLLGLPDTVLVSWLTLVGAGVTIYFTLSGLSYLVVYVLARRRFHPDYVPDPASNHKAMRLAVVSTLGNITLMMPFQLLIASGHSRIYWAGTARGAMWIAVSVLLYIAFVDTWIYWVHRMLHTDFFYRHLHRYHHQWQVPNSWVSMAFHPVDSFLFALPVHLFGFLMPLHGFVYLGMQILMSFWSVSSHDRVSILRRRWFNYADNHTLHHWFYRCNYGQFFTFWDRLMGTWRNPAEEAGAGTVPAGVLR